MTARPFRWSTVLLGVLLGLVISLAFVFGWAQESPGLYTAQASAYPLPFATAAQTLAVVGDFSLVAASLPESEVYLPYEIPSDAALGVLVALADSLDLAVCRLESGVVLLGVNLRCDAGGSPAGVASGNDLESEALPAEVEPADGGDSGSVPDPVREEPQRYAVRVYIVEINEDRATELGIDWRQLFNTANLLRTQLDVMLAGYVGAPTLDGVVSFLEREGLGRRLDDLTLLALEGEPVQFNRGGSINVALVAGQDVQRATYQIGLTATLTVTAEGDDVQLAYQISDVSPSNVSDPQNIQLSSTSNSSRVRMACGDSSTLVALGSERISGSGEGLPVAGAVPGLGYAFATGADSFRRSSVVVTASVECL